MAEQLLYKLKINASGLPYLAEDGRKYKIEKRRSFFESSRDIYKLTQDMGYTDDAEESFCMLCLNNRCKPIAVFEVAHGQDTSCYVSMKQVYTRALMVGASFVVFWHNHPSDEVDPSDQDIDITRMLIDAGKLLNIQVIDHLIVSKNHYYSMYELRREIFEDK